MTNAACRRSGAVVPVLLSVAVSTPPMFVLVFAVTSEYRPSIVRTESWSATGTNSGGGAGCRNSQVLVPSKIAIGVRCGAKFGQSIFAAMRSNSCMTAGASMVGAKARAYASAIITMALAHAFEPGLKRAIYLFLDVDTSGTSVQFQARAAAVHRSAQLVAIDGALDGERKVGAHRAGAGAGHQVELRGFRQAHADSAGTGIQVPIAGLLPLCLDAAAPSVRFQFTGDVLQADVS